MVGAKVCKNAVAKSSKSAVVLTTDFDIADLATAMDCRLDILSSGLNPLYRLSLLHRDPAKQGLFAVDVELGAKATAHFGSDHPKLVFWDSDHQGELSS